MATTSARSIDEDNTSLAELIILLSERPEEFLRPKPEFQGAAIRAAKVLLDSLATDIADTQIARRNENRKKRKRGGDDEQEDSVLQVRQIYTKGFGVKQVWEQAKRILDAAEQEIQRDVQSHGSKLGVTSSRSGTNGKMVVDETQSDDEALEAVHSDDDLDSEDLEEEMDDGNLSNEEEVELEDNETEEDIEAGSDLIASSDEDTQTRREIYIQDPNGLNDGFFSIDDFNKQSQFLEQMDARGDDDNPSDEDEIDWDADPRTAAPTKSTRSDLEDGLQDADESEEDEDGPTFDDADLNASDDDDEAEIDGEQDLDGMTGGLSNANEIRYADFFEPPAKKPSKNKRMRALPKTQPPKADYPLEGQGDDETQLENDLERAIADVRRDLLDSEDEEADLSEDMEDVSGDDLDTRRNKPSDKNMSTHEKQRAAIAVEIRRLEAANVAKRDWQLSGEARAADRPLNSLIEEDLEFERTGKPVTPVTVETTDEIDSLIKRRILAREFDEVVRRLPGSINLASETKRGRIELDDSKPQASLGEIYEAEHQKNADPLSYVDKRSAAVKKQHEEIDILWKEVRDQLDLLSNMNFKPKRVEVEIKTVEDRPRIAMEDARPVGEIESGQGGMLAAQEIYRPGADVASKKVLTKGEPLSREEMSREEKLRHRRREKERIKKTSGNREIQVLGKASKGQKPGKKEKEVDKANIIEDLKRGGVKVVGKEGELQSLGKQKKGDRNGGEFIGANLKL